MTGSESRSCRTLVVVLGDQLDRDAAVFDSFDNERDAVLMMEVAEEATYVPQHKIRLVLFFSAMRHFRDELAGRGRRVVYVELEDRLNRASLAAELGRWINKLHPERVLLGRPGDHRVLKDLRAAARDAGCPLDLVEDRHFLTTPADFAEFAEGRSSLVLEYFYREQRRRYDVLMRGDQPEGGAWNYDQDNRASFGKDGPGHIKAPRSFRTDRITDEVVAMVERRFPGAPGSLERFDYPVTHDEARAALRDFVEHRLASFGRYQDAMVSGRPYLYHSRLSAVMNLHLLDPRDVISAVLKAYDEEAAPLNSAEGFVRQVLGWREYMRGVYWHHMPDYAGRNALDADLPVPAFLWTGDTDMNCIRQSVSQLIEHAYAHHIQRLMVLGLFCMLLGVRPYDVHRWHMSMYADAIDWVSLPNVLGMSQYGDGGLVASKPYAASGNYINKMSDYCRDCRYRPGQAIGDEACPFTTLYWDFLSRNRNRIRNNRRMNFQLNNLNRKDDGERRDIRQAANRLKTKLTEKTYL